MITHNLPVTRRVGFSTALVAGSLMIGAGLLAPNRLAAEVDLAKVQLPEGFSISLYAEDLEDARSIAHERQWRALRGKQATG